MYVCSSGKCVIFCVYFSRKSEIDRGDFVCVCVCVRACVRVCAYKSKYSEMANDFFEGMSIRDLGCLISF